MEYQAHHSESESVAVMVAMSDFRDCPITSLPPLANFIDPDALDGVLSHTHCATDSQEVEVVFDYDGTLVSVNQNKEISLGQPEKVG